MYLNERLKEHWYLSGQAQLHGDPEGWAGSRGDSWGRQDGQTADVTFQPGPLLEAKSEGHFPLDCARLWAPLTFTDDRRTGQAVWGE